MINSHPFRKIGLLLYLFVYLIFPYSAITETKKLDLKRNLENSLNSRNFEFVEESLWAEEIIKLKKRFSKIVEEFPNATWQIKRSESKQPYENIFKVRVTGQKVIGEETYQLESNFKYLFSINNKKINQGIIKNLFSTVRNDNNKIDITFKIPDKVLTGAKYDIDVILNDPLGDIIIAGGIKSYQEESFLKQEIDIEPLATGGIFKMTRAPIKTGTQIWSGVIAHPEGIITFTKSVEIVEKI